MRYLLLIYSNEAESLQQTPAQLDAEMNAYYKFSTDVQKAGVHRSGEALDLTTKWKSVRARNGKTLTTDGPFVETKEQLGGFYLLDCANLDEAIQWAAQIPTATRGSIEIRPIMELG